MLFDLGFLATCNAGGAGKFSKGFSVYFQDRHVVLLPDNDDAGRKHVREVAAILAPVASSIRISSCQHCRPKTMWSTGCGLAGPARSCAA